MRAAEERDVDWRTVNEDLLSLLVEDCNRVVNLDIAFQEDAIFRASSLDFLFLFFKILC